MSRYAFDDLWIAMGRPNPTHCGEQIGTTTRTAARLRGQTLDHERAERYASAAGLHPFEVWPEFTDTAIAAVEQECADERCSARFVPTLPHNIYCSPVCGKRSRAREWARRKYQSDPDWAARKRANRLAYYEECGDYERRTNAARARRGRADGRYVDKRRNVA